ncbi:MAG TPA: hemerythrin domain-containing protein [Candidatus Acidoferrales bacterium]|jgi:hemerythrin-like domain-containing protein|nr:hemerythrin domain-containing protein [Candidatus Acidoferrales bacterium]
MPELPVTPADEAVMVHEEHVELRTNLDELDHALNCLRLESGAGGDLSGAPLVRSMIRRFRAFLPLHFQHEEKSLLERVSAVSPELKDLTFQLKEEHRFLADLFEAFAETASKLNSTGDVSAEVSRTKLLGEAFTNRFLLHMSTEETELAGFL